ncbi:MAG: PAS domain-containing sensor histidine kinase [Candidatus Lokiarchaeota archaeon]|nr:PAS domain-containing sensor histidine kinase [Candidatus Lokiarchaeota archaeon]
MNDKDTNTPDQSKTVDNERSIYDALNTIGDVINDMITIVDEHIKIIYVNQDVHKKQAGYTENDLIGQNALDFIHPDDKDAVIAQFENAIHLGEGFIEARIRKKDQTYMWTQTKGKSFIDKDEKIKILLITRDITEHKTIEQKLRDTTERYKHLADSLTEVIFELDTSFNLTYTNSIAAIKFGYSYEDFKKGLNIYNFLHPDELKDALNNLKRLKRGESVDPSIFRLKKKDGSYFYANIYATPVYKEGKVTGIRSIVHDISEMIAAQERIEESEQRFRTIAEQSLMGICMIQEEKIIYINEALANILGYNSQELLKWERGKFFETIHPDDKKRIILAAVEAIKDEETNIRSYQARGINKNGEIIWLDIYYKIVTYQKKPTFLISFIDITERKQAEEKLKESEEKYRFLFEKSPFFILLINNQGKIINCNPALETLIGYRQDEIIGKLFSQLPSLDKDIVPVLSKRFKKIINGQSLPPIDIQAIKKDKTQIWINIESSLINLGGNKYNLVMGHDISKKKEVEEKLKDLDELRKEFIDRASHELKTPITTVYGAYQLLNTLYRDKFSVDQLEILDLAFSGTKRLKKLVDDLLDVSKIESKMLLLNKQRTNLSIIVKKCMKELRYLSNRRNHKIELDLPEELELNIDRSRIELVLTNLISNAIKYTPIDGRISISLAKKDNYVELKIEDNGIGLANEEISQLFKKFSKIQSPIDKEMGLDSSTGLGLYISKEIIELHDGKIWAESKGKGRGSTFIVNLPLS